MSDEDVLGFHAKPTTGLKAAKPLLEVHNLSRQFQTPSGVLKVLEDVNFSIEPGKSVAIVGLPGVVRPR